MRVATALLPGGMNWRLRPTDPMLSPVGDDWFVVNPLIQLLPRSLDTIVLPVDGDVMLLRHGVLHLVVPEGVDHSSFSERLEAALSHLRLLTLDPGCPTSIGGTGFQEVAELPTPEEPSAHSGMKIKFFGNRDRTATTLERLAEAFKLRSGPPPSAHGSLVLDAIAAVAHDPRKAILYAAFAVEVLAGDVLNRAYGSAIASAIVPSDLRIIERAVSKSASVRKDPIYEQLQASARRRFSLLLHELPLYMMRRSLLQDDEALYNSALKLQESRNLLAHRGNAGTSSETFPPTSKGAHDALEIARRVFHWFGERDYFIGL
jgi:hypothetical protein